MKYRIKKEKDLNWTYIYTVQYKYEMKDCHYLSSIIGCFYWEDSFTSWECLENAQKELVDIKKEFNDLYLQRNKKLVKYIN